MTKRFVTFPLFLLAALILTVSASADAESGQMEIANRSDADGAFSCDVNLSGGQIHGSVFAALFAESGRMKCASGYPAMETVQVALPDVAETDYIKIMWLDEQCAPLTHPAMLRMSGNGSSAYEKFAEEFLKLQEEYGGSGGGTASGSDDPYILARLLVSCAELPDLSDYHVVAMISGPDNLYVLQFNTAGEAKECAEYLRTFPSVRYAEPDSIMQADSAEASAADSVSWGTEATGIAAYAENLRQRGINHSIIVAAVDSGADLEHPFLKGRLVSGYDFIDKDDAPQDSYGHGTHVAGIIADCTPGTDVKIMPVRVLDSYGTGSASYIGAGVRYAADHGANVINLSLGLMLGHSSYVEEAIAYAISKNITVVVAAGNQNSDVKERCPAHMEECVTVAAADRNWKRFELSNYGETVDIAAPGVAINSSLPGGKYGEMSGTSMAAPHVSAAAALLMEERGAAQTPAQISRALRDSAASLDVSGEMAFQESVRFGAGFLNLTPFIIHPQRTVAFYANGGTGDMTPQSAASGSLIALKANAFSLDGYQFAGWNTNADGSGDAYPDGATLTVTQNLSLYAQWEQERVLYALLYTDGEIVFQNSDTPSPGRVLEEVYKIPATGGTGEYVKWHDRRADIRTVTFADSIKPTSTVLWFYGCENLTEVRGLENLDASQVTDMSQMFARCASLTTLDLSALDTRNVTRMRQMFFQCAALTTIYASGAFSVADVTESMDMFTGCTSLVGGSGTKYDSARTDKERARIDTASASGYFTDKNSPIPAPTPSNGIYAILYGDGEFVFQNNDRTESGRSVMGVYKVDRSYSYNHDSRIASTPWYEYRSYIKTVIFMDKIQPISTACWFLGCYCLQRIDNIENLDTSNVTNMSYMFYECSGSYLTALDVSSFDTSRVKNMSYMFYYCNYLTTLDVSDFNTSKVTTMRSMFQYCSDLKVLDLSSFDTSRVTDMSCMFDGCQKLKALDLSHFDTSRVTNMSKMFSFCRDLKTLNLSSFDTSNVTDMNCMFETCTGLTALEVSNFDTSNVADMSYMFSNCDGLTALDVASFDTSNVKDMSSMFSNCANLKTIYASEKFKNSLIKGNYMFSKSYALVGGAGTKYNGDHIDSSYARIDGGADNPGYFTIPPNNIYAILYSDGTFVFQYSDTPKSGKSVTKTYETNLNAVYDWRYPGVADTPWYNERESLRIVNFADKISPAATAYWFMGCKNLERLDNIQNLDTTCVTDMEDMFGGCSGLTTLDLSGFDTANVTDMSGMFVNCSGLTTLDLSGFDTANVTDMYAMFYGCSGLTTLDVSSFDTANVTSMREMFHACSGLTALDVSSFDTANVTYMREMFHGCSGLTALDVSNFNTANVTSMREMFRACSGLTALDVSNFNTANITDMYEMFSDCSGLTALDVSHFDTANVTSMSGIFHGCSGLTALDVSHFDTGKVTSMSGMFYGCSGLTKLDVSHFDTGKVTSMSGMFYGCSGLTKLDVSSFDTAKVTNMGFMFEFCNYLKTIYASGKFTVVSVKDDYSRMFYACDSLVGGSGTKYDSAHIDKEYACIDGGADNPGYFTRKS